MMRFDIYGRFTLEVVRQDGRWAAFRLDGGKRRPFGDFVIPAGLPPEAVAGFLDDMLHEFAAPRRSIRRLD